MPKSNAIRVGIAGVGVMGRRRQSLVEAHPHMALVAVEDSDYRRLFDHSLDALFVCLPNYLAAQATIAGLERDLHVFCEKPPGRDLDDIAAVMRCHASRPNKALMYGFNHRYHGSVRTALEIINSGRLGTLHSLRGVYAKVGMSGWRTDRRQSGGGILLDQGIHMLDLFLLFGGRFSNICGRIRTHGEYNVDDNVWALLEGEHGEVATLTSTATADHPQFELDLSFDDGAIALRGILSGSMSYAPEKIHVVGAISLDREYTDDTSFAEEVDQFSRAVRNGIQVHTGTPAQAYAAMALVYRIYCADETWQKAYDLRVSPRESMV